MELQRTSLERRSGERRNWEQGEVSLEKPTLGRVSLKPWGWQGREGKASWLPAHTGGGWKSTKVEPGRSRFRPTSITTEQHPRLHRFLQKQTKHPTILQMQRNQYFWANGHITEIEICTHQMLAGSMLENCHCCLIVSGFHCVIPSTHPWIKTKNFLTGKLFLKSLTCHGAFMGILQKLKLQPHPALSN